MTLGIYSVAADISVCPEVDSASENEYQDIPGGKGGRCVRVMTLQPSCAECLVIWSLNRPEPSRPHRPLIGVEKKILKILKVDTIVPRNKGTVRNIISQLRKMNVRPSL